MTPVAPVTPVTHASSAVPSPKPGGPLSYIHWGPVVSGAIIATAILFVLTAFGIALGLSMASPSPTWRSASVGLALLSGIWVLFSMLLAIGVGAFVAGRVRNSWSASEDEVHFRDGLHGMITWGLTIVLTVILGWLAATAASPKTAVTDRPGTAEPAFLTFEVDRLFRADRRNEVDAEARAEAGRILMSSAGRADMAPEDRSYLSRLVATRAGVAPPEADRRVGVAIAETDKAQKQARRSAILVAFMIGAASFVSAALAWFAAGVGGHQRDNDIVPFTRQSWHGDSPRFLQSSRP